VEDRPETSRRVSVQEAARVLETGAPITLISARYLCYDSAQKSARKESG